MAADLDAQRGDLAQAAKGVGRQARAGQCSVRVRVVQPHINARGAGYAVTRHAKVRQGFDHGLFNPVDIFLDVIARALQIDQRISHHLAWAVVGHLPAPVALHHGNVAGVEQMVSLAGQALGKDRRVLANP